MHTVIQYLESFELFGGLMYISQFVKIIISLPFSIVNVHPLSIYFYTIISMILGFILKKETKIDWFVIS